MKPCTRCGVDKDLSDFGVQESAPDGHKWMCKACDAAAARAWREKNRDYARARDKIRNATPERHQRNLEAARANHLRRAYNLTPVEYAAMLAKQHGRCAFCSQAPQPNQPRSKLVVDHDHKTGRTRWLLCDSCNGAAGAINENFARMRAIARYIRDHLK